MSTKGTPASGLTLQVGEPIPSIGLRATDGYLLNLRTFVGKQPVAILFFAGPTVSGKARALGDALAAALAEAIPRLHAAGISVVGVTCDSDRQQTEYAAAHTLPFLLMSDERRVAVEALGIRVAETAGSWNVAPPVLIGVDEAGTVRGIFKDPDPRLMAATILEIFREPLPA